MIGTVKWFNKRKGYGFIAPESGDPDIFVHITALKNSGIFNLKENDLVEFEVKEFNGKPSADNLKLKNN